MEIILPPIKPGESGPPVANLQDALLILLERNVIRAFDAPDQPTKEELQRIVEDLKRERDRSVFRAATGQLLMFFQVQQGLGDNLRDVGVDEKTAAKLNQLLEKLGLLDIPKPEDFVIRGAVTTSDGQPIPGALVHAFDRDMRKRQSIGDAQTDATGQFVIRYSRSHFELGDEPSSSGPALIIQAFIGDQKIGDDVSRPKATRDEAVNFTLPAPTVSEWETLTAAILPLLKGQGNDDENLPPWDFNDDDITFIVEETGLEREKIRLWALAFAASRDFAVEIQPVVLTSNVRNVDFLSTPDIALVSIPYAWFRLGLPEEETALWATPTETLLTTLSEAIKKGIVPANVGADLDELRKRIELVKLDRVLRAPTAGTATTLSDVLSTIPVSLNVDQKRAIAAASSELRVDDPNLVNKITANVGLDRSAAVGVAHALRLGDLTGGHVPLAQALQVRLIQAEESEGTMRPLAAIRPDEWLDLAYTHGVPEGTAITPVEYAESLAMSVEQQHPTASIRAHFTDERRLAQHPRLADVGTFLRNNTDFDIMTANLNAVTDQAKLEGVPEPRQAQLVDGLRSLQRMKVLGASCDEITALFENDLYSPPQILDAGPVQLTTLLNGRIAPARIAAVYQQAEELRNLTFAGFTAAFSPLSAPRILPIPTSDPVNPGGIDGVIPPVPIPTGDIPHTGDPLGNVNLKDFADAVAHHLASREQALDPGWGRVVPSPREGIVIPDQTPSLDLSPFIDHQPTLQALFGSQEACACGHCKSVLSPSAYFVDILEFLKHGEISGKLLDELLSRRPDLQDIELSCNNTNTEVPAIDLALEILENAVALPLSVELPAGTRIEDQLRSGQPVGVAVRAALEKTVSTLPASVTATREGNSGEWTVVDGHRRWKLSAQAEDALKAQIGSGRVSAVDTTGIDLPALVAALDRHQVARGTESTFAHLFAANQRNPNFADYHVTIESMKAPGHKSWRVLYRFAAELVIDSTQLTLQNVAREVWLRREYEQQTLREVERDLDNNKVPPVVQKLVASKFPDASKLSVKADESGRPKTWTLTSTESMLTLTFAPAELNITSFTYQSGDPDADPIAWPENHNSAAYVKLTGDDVVFPWSLPLDLPLEEVRLFLERARSSRRTLIELTQPVNDSLSNNDVFAREVLGLGRSEANLIVTQKTDPAVFGCWGVAPGQRRIWDAGSARFLDRTTTLSLLQNVSILLQQSRLSFSELQTVLATRFVQGNAAPLLITPDNSCKPSEMTVATLTSGHLDRIHRFVRLQRRLGWSEEDLDTAILLTTGALLNEDTLGTLADLKQLRELLDVPLASTLAWYSQDISDEHKKILLARALGLTTDELEHAIELFSISNPVANPTTTLAFCQRVKNFLRGNLKFEDLLYLIRHESTLGSNTDLDANQLSTFADAVRNVIVSIQDPPEKALASAPAALESAESRAAREQESIRIAKENDANLIATRLARENAVIATLATAVGATRELVDELLRIRLRHPENASRPAIDVFLSPLSDFIDVASLIRKLGTDSDATSIGSHLWSRFSPADQLVLRNSESTSQQQEDILVSVLNSILRGSSIYNATLFKRVTLSAETTELQSAIPAVTGDQLIKLNRLLLEDSFPLEIAKRRSTDSLFVAGEVAEPGSVLVQTVLTRLYKSALICDALKLSRTDLPLLRKGATDDTGLSGLDFNSLPVAATNPAEVTTFAKLLTGFEQLLALVQLRGIARGAGDMLNHYAALNFAATTTVPWTKAAANQVLITGLNIKAQDVENAATQLHITTADQYRDPIVLKQLIELLVVLKQLDTTMEAVYSSSAPSLIDPNGFASVSPNDRDANAARELLRAKYGESQWHDLIKPIADKLRERQRNALLDYLIAQSSLPRVGDTNPLLLTGPRLRDANDVYEFYLIDVQTSSCLKTTRLLQATAAAQLFIQRLLLNLEHNLPLTEDKRALWEWMHNYRVWEANRKVFLYPENWLLPELRDDKTSTFDKMESAFTEGEPSRELIRGALLGYVEDLGELAQINVIAMYADYRSLPDESGKNVVICTLYVIGRTADQPYQYHWRSCTNFGSGEMSWSGWEALDLDNANDFIMPFVFEGDLHAAWPVFRETNDEKDESKLWWQVQLAWARHTSKGWVKRKIGESQVALVERLPNKEALDSFTFRLKKEISNLLFGDQTLSQELIGISIYAASETVDIGTFTPTFRPDPSLVDVKDSDPVPSGSLNKSDWNTHFSLEGVAYEFATVDQATRYRPLPGMTIEVRYWTRKDEFGGTNPRSYSITTTPDGQFTFSSTTPPDLSTTPPNTPQGVINGGEISLTFRWPGQKPTVLKRTLTLEGYGYAMWNWKFSIGVINKRINGLTKPTIADTYFPTRPVKLVGAGSFVIQSGQDLRYNPNYFNSLGNRPSLLLAVPPGSGTPVAYEMAIDGNRFSLRQNPNPFDPPMSAVGIKFGNVNSVFLRAYSLPVVAQLAIQSPATTGQASSPVWYIQTNEGGFYFQQQLNGLQRWPDGQPFAPSYRIAASISTDALFQPATESHVHIDSLANNFLRKFPYANYNWELFLHAPLAISDHLASQQRFEDARKWLHAVFDPTTDKKDKNKIPQFWRFLPFDNATQPLEIAKLLTWLADPNLIDPRDTQIIEDQLKWQVKEWKKNPFMPHAIARLRQSAYQWYTFFAYLEVLIGWGDQLFRRDTRESVNDATLLYVLAAKLLGPRPRTTPPSTPPYELTYRLLLGDPNQIDSFSNAWVNYADLPGVKQLVSAQASTTRVTQSFALTKTSSQPSDHVPVPLPNTSSILSNLSSLSALAFCVPQNDKLTEFYDRVEKRLFDIRNCRNIEGDFRELPLYQPPIDPLLLIRARAAGLDIDSVVAGTYAPLPNYRFSFILQKATEFCAELKSLGGALLSALEKQDAEQLTLLRSGHEIAMLKLVRDTRQLQITEAEANLVALRQTAATVLERFGQYQRLLGNPSVSKGQDGLPVVEQSSSLAVSTDTVGFPSNMGLSRKEVDQLVLSAFANSFTQAANATNLIAGILSLFPNIWAGDALVAGQTFGGSNLGVGASSLARAMEMGATQATYFANQAGVFGGYERRQDEWVHQSKLALSELKQIQQQILAAEIRKDIAERELKNHDAQIENAQAVDDFMRSKFTSQQLFRWMSSQIAEVYFRTYQLALDQAQRAERAYQHELGLDNSTPFVQSGNWDSLKRGLLAGEHLHHDLKRMESAYLERNTRELEITKHISLLQLDPLALVALKETGACDFEIPEVFFDLDYPGHYLRRIKMVSLSIPCVVGPYASVNAALRLTRNSIRINPKVDAAADSYKRKGTAPDDDPRFRESSATITTIVTSSGQQDSGMFEPNLRDERFLPFEGAGAISRWHLELPSTFEAFDYDTISDVVLHVRYTSRDGGDSLKSAVAAQLVSAMNAIASATATGNPGLTRLVSFRHEFPTEWHTFLNPPETKNGQTLEFQLSQDRFPFLFRRETIQIQTLDIFLRIKDEFLVDYQSGDSLVVDITPPGPPPKPKKTTTPLPTLVSNDSDQKGLPHAQKDFVNDFDKARDLGKWSLEIKEDDIKKIAPSLQIALEAGNGNHARLKRSVIEDLFIVFRYSI